MQECALYCTGCAFVTDATQPCHEKECLSGSNKELNRLAKLSITDFPLIETNGNVPMPNESNSNPTRQQNTVLVVRRHKIIDLVKDLEDEILSQHPSIIDITFARNFFIQFNRNVGLMSKMTQLNDIDINRGCESSGSSMPINVMKAVPMSHFGFYKFFSSKSFKAGKDGVFQGEAERRQKLIRTIESYELGGNIEENTTTDIAKNSAIEEEKQRTIILLGSAIRRVNRGKGNQKLIWLKRLFGPRCQSVVSGEVGKDPDMKADKADKVSDFIHYALVRLNDEREMLRVLIDCQYHYLINEHLNLMPLLTFLTTPIEKCPSPEKRSNSSPKKNQRGSLKKPNEKMANRKKRELSSPQSQSSSPVTSPKKLPIVRDNIGQQKNLLSPEQNTRKQQLHTRENGDIVNNVNADFEIKSSDAVPKTISTTDKSNLKKKSRSAISTFSDTDMLDFDKLLNEVRRIHQVGSADEASDDEDEAESRLVIDNDHAEYHSDTESKVEETISRKTMSKEATSEGKTGAMVKLQKHDNISNEQRISSSPIHGQSETTLEEAEADVEMVAENDLSDNLEIIETERITNSRVIICSEEVGRKELSAKKDQSISRFEKCYVDVSPLTKEKLESCGSNELVKRESETKVVKSNDITNTISAALKDQKITKPESEGAQNYSFQDKSSQTDTKKDEREEKQVERATESNLAENNQKAQDNLLKRIGTLEKLVQQWKNVCNTTKEEATQEQKKWKIAEEKYKSQLSDVKNVFFSENVESETKDKDLSQLLKLHLEESNEKHRLALEENESKLRDKMLKERADERESEVKLRESQLHEAKYKYEKDLAELNSKLKEEEKKFIQEQNNMVAERKRLKEVEEEIRKSHQNQIEQLQTKFKNDISESNEKWKSMVDESNSSHKKKEELWTKEKETTRQQLSSIQNEFNACRQNYDEAKKELDACNCKKNASKSFVSKPSQTDKYDAVNEEIMTLQVKIDMLEKDKQQIKEQHELKLKEKDDEVAKAVAVQTTLNKTIDDHKQQFALCQINLEVTSKELELANAKIKATEDGTNKESMPFNVEESEEYKKLKENHVGQIKELVQKNVIKMATLNKKLTETKKENEELKSTLEEGKTSYEQQLANQKNYTRQFENEVKDLKVKLSKTVIERDTMASNVQQFKQTLNSSSNSEGQLKSEIDRLTRALNEEKTKGDEMANQLQEKDMNSSRDLKTQAAMYEGDIAKLKGQIVAHKLDEKQRVEELQKLKADLSTKDSKIENMANQREKQNKAMERWSNERGMVENVLQTLPKTIDSLQEIKHSIPNSNSWPSKEALYKLDYKEKIKTIQDILICTVGYCRTLKNDADANMNKIDENAAAARQVEMSRKALVEEQQKYQKKVDEFDKLENELSQVRSFKEGLEKELKTATDTISQNVAKNEAELQAKTNEYTKSIEKYSRDKTEGEKEIKKVIMLAN